MTGGPREHGAPAIPCSGAEVRFELPVGLRDESGRMLREGTMRPAGAEQEAAALRDFLVYLDPASFPRVLLSKVTAIERVGTPTPFWLGRLAPLDLWFLEVLYRAVNAYPTDFDAASHDAVVREAVVREAVVREAVDAAAAETTGTVAGRRR